MNDTPGNPRIASRTRMVPVAIAVTSQARQRPHPVTFLMRQHGGHASYTSTKGAATPLRRAKLKSFCIQLARVRHEMPNQSSPDFDLLLRSSRRKQRPIFNGISRKV